jgi:hypothetical protein
MLEFIERLLSWLLLAFCIFMLFLICIIVVFIESIFMYLSICLIIYGE